MMISGHEKARRKAGWESVEQNASAKRSRRSTCYGSGGSVMTEATLIACAFVAGSISLLTVMAAWPGKVKRWPR